MERARAAVEGIRDHPARRGIRVEGPRQHPLGQGDLAREPHLRRDARLRPALRILRPRARQIERAVDEGGALV